MVREGLGEQLDPAQYHCLGCLMEKLSQGWWPWALWRGWRPSPSGRASARQVEGWPDRVHWVGGQQRATSPHSGPNAGVKFFCSYTWVNFSSGPSWTELASDAQVGSCSQ